MKSSATSSNSSQLFPSNSHPSKSHPISSYPAAPFLAKGLRPVKKPLPHHPLLPLPPHFPPFKRSHHPSSLSPLQFPNTLINPPLHTPKALLPTPTNLHKAPLLQTPPSSLLNHFLYQIPASTIYSQPLPTPLYPLFNNQSSLNHSPNNIPPHPIFTQSQILINLLLSLLTSLSPNNHLTH